MAQSATSSARISPRSIVVGFIAGALSVAIFQSAVGGLLYAAGLSPNAPWRMVPVPPFGVPQTLNFMFWGGLWGIAMLPVLANAGSGFSYWLAALLFGGIVVSAVLMFVVLPIKGRPIAFGWDMSTWARVFVQHAAFGLGVAFFLRLFAGLGRAT